MRLIELRIENFGGLHDLSLSFEGGLNIFLRENGWGKSTLMAFIRVMFYGFAGEQKRKIEENERKRYRPWQGGVYGGSLLFSVGDRCYRLERSFGEKKEDSFSLYDAKSGLPSEDYSEKIGEELFQLDRESFSKSLFTGQLEAETGATAGINAKIGDLAAEEADMGQYKIAQIILKKQSDFLTPGRKTGRISRLREEIQTLEYESSLLLEHRKRQAFLEKEIPNLEEKIKRLSAEKEKLQKEILSRGKRLEAEAKRKREKAFPEAEEEEKRRDREEREGGGLLFGAGLTLGLCLLFFGFFLKEPYLAAAGGLLFIFMAGFFLRERRMASSILEKRDGRRDREKGQAKKGRAEKGRVEKRQAPKGEKKNLSSEEGQEEESRQLGSEESLEKLARKLEQLGRVLEEARREKEKKQLAIEAEEVYLEELRQKQERLEAKREEEKEIVQRYRIIELTRQSLEKARENFAARYLDSIKESFDHYYEVIAGKEDKDFFLDTNLELRKREKGQLREISMMSRGHQDLIGICRRMAFLDAMYGKEKPPVFFDDPFAGLDEEKTEGGMSLLEEIADRYQVIYLTCHKDRT